jgi:hypothetical protein
VTHVTASANLVFHNEIVLIEVAVEERLSLFAFGSLPEKTASTSEEQKAKSEERSGID